MTLADLITRALTLLASGVQPGPLEALEAAAQGDTDALAAALELLDGMTPEIPVTESAKHPTCSVTFLQWADGAEAHAENPDDPSERLSFSYGEHRPRGEVLELLGKACMVLSRGEERPWS